VSRGLGRSPEFSVEMMAAGRSDLQERNIGAIQSKLANAAKGGEMGGGNGAIHGI